MKQTFKKARKFWIEWLIKRGVFVSPSASYQLIVDHLFSMGKFEADWFCLGKFDADFYDPTQRQLGYMLNHLWHQERTK